MMIYYSKTMYLKIWHGSYQQNWQILLIEHNLRILCYTRVAHGAYYKPFSISC